jgi:hypothetical protein
MAVVPALAQEPAGVERLLQLVRSPDASR